MVPVACTKAEVASAPRRWWSIVALLGLGLVILGCGSGSGTGGTADGGADGAVDVTTACTPGASVACVGPRGCSGFQVCNQTGSGFDPCDCGALDSGTDADAADATVPPDAAADGDASPLDARPDVTPPNDGPAVLSGAIQKGPFVLGSSVAISAIDTSGSPTGQVFNTQTADDLGSFDVTFAYRGYVDMQAEGFYYDEVTGALSGSAIVLRALYDVTNGGPQNAYINIVTHLAHDRARQLMADGGVGLEGAEAQAESELVNALGIGGTGFQPGGAGVTLNELGSNSVPNAYLFAVSAVLVQAAIEQGGSLDAQLQQLLDTIAADLADDGQLAPALASQVRTAQTDLDVDLTADLFADRLAAIGSAATPANLNLAIDSDGDGYRNAIDTCPLVANPNQAQIPANVLCDVTRHTGFQPGWTALPSCLVLGDFTSSGHPGVLACGEGGGASSATLLPGDGTGRFSSSMAVQLPVGLTPVLAFDVNQDGKLDVVGGSGWVAGNGAGQFGGLNAFYTGTTFPQSVVLGDFNGDAVPDVAGIDGNGAVRLALAMAPGVFGPPIVISSSGASLFAADIDGDAKLDLVDFGLGSGAVESFLGDGTGNFRGMAPASLSGNTYALADFDGDGRLDAAGWADSGGSTGAVAIAFGDGNGGFGARGEDAPLPPGSVGVGDFNADGKADVWVASVDQSPCPAGAQILLSEGTAFAPPQILRSTLATCYGPVRLVIGDLVGAGMPDVVLASQGATGTWNVQGYVVGECLNCTCSGTVCDGVCVDTANNADDCSACDGECSGGQYCRSGLCVCPGSSVFCNGECVDLATSNANCNGCGKVCAVGGVCQAGVCGCPTGLTLCGGTCVDLTSDNANCGACNAPCSAAAPSSAQCTQSACLVTLSTTSMKLPYGVALQGSNVYWTDYFGAVYSVPSGGGATTTLNVTANSDPLGIVVNSTTIYWPDTGNSTLVSIPISGGTPTTLQSNQLLITGVAIDTNNIYWSWEGLFQQSLTGGAVTTLDGTEVIGDQGDIHGLAVDSTSVYYRAYSTGPFLAKVPIGGGTVTTLAANQSPIGLAVDARNVYWINGGSNGYVAQMPVDGGTVTTLAAGLGILRDIAVDGTFVYWSEQDSRLVKAPIGGGAPVTILSTVGQPFGIAVDAASIYWAEPPAIRRYPK